MSAVDVVLQVFRSVEERNPQLAAEVYHDDLESTGRFPARGTAGRTRLVWFATSGLAAFRVG